MKTSVIVLLAVGAWSYSLAQDTVRSSQPARTAGSQTELTASHFLKKALKMSKMEIEAGQLAAQKAQSADVKSYGSRMVKDHTEAADQLKALATRKNISLSMSGENLSPANAASTATARDAASTQAASDAQPTKATTQANPAATTSTRIKVNDGEHYSARADTGKHAGYQEKLNKLRQSTGGAFDREYMTMMVSDHTKAITLFEKGAELDDADIRDFATRTLPILRDHLASAQTILNTLASVNK